MVASYYQEEQRGVDLSIKNAEEKERIATFELKKTLHQMKGSKMTNRAPRRRCKSNGLGPPRNGSK